MHEKNLKDALRQLPQYQAPRSIWEHIEENLEREGYLHQAIAELPVYTAPDGIWERIEGDLGQGTRIRRLPVWGWSAAAGVAIVITAAIGIYQWNQTRGQVSYAYSEESIQAINSPRDWDEAEADVLEVQKRFAHYCQYQSQQESDCALEKELKELNEAKAELKDVMARYGEDPDLIRELSELELDRSRVVKAMVEKIQTS